MPEFLGLLESAEPEQSSFDCVEIYLPKRLKHLSELYGFLRAKVEVQTEALRLQEFSIYEVDGAFRGEHGIWEERTLVIRILFRSASTDPRGAIEGNIRELGSELATTVAPHEEEIWVCHYRQGVSIFRPQQ